MRLFITTRVSHARALAQALSALHGSSHKRPLSKQADHFSVGQESSGLDVVTWCGGHWLELAAPEVYDARYRQWRLEDLPILPSGRPPRWQMVEAGEGRSGRAAELKRQAQFIGQALPRAHSVVHAGDPDREGQWQIDEMLDYWKERGVLFREPVQRLLLKDLNLRALRAALKHFEAQPVDNTAFYSLSISARTRSRADWLYGLNMTRAYTLLGRHGGHEDMLSVGRVQTALLALVVKRDEQIEQFVPEPLHHLRIKLVRGDDYCYGEYASVADGPTENKPLQVLAEKLRGKMFRLQERDTRHHVESPPLPLDLSSLQIECAERLGYSGMEVIRIARALYEEHHLISYPLSDCRYLPEKNRQEAEAVLEAVASNLKSMEVFLKQADTWRSGRAWDNERLSHHHAIVPSAHVLESGALSEEEQRVYELVVRYYLAQFYPDAESLEEKLVFIADGETFVASRWQDTQSGWKQLLFPPAAAVRTVPLPDWPEGTEVPCEDWEIRESKTRPLPRFTEASLLQAMAHIAPFVSSEEVRSRLQERDGLGTESTRARMLDTLCQRGYLIRGKRHIFSAPIGRDLIHALPAAATAVEMTALWEQQLSHMARLPAQEAEAMAGNFLAEVQRSVEQFIAEAKQKKNIVVNSADDILGIQQEKKFHCPKCASVLRLRHGPYGDFWGCSAYPACSFATKYPH